MFLRKPATVVQWHRNGFRLYWRWRSRCRPGRPPINREVRDLIHQISRANPLWGAPRIHGEIRKLGINVSQATVARCMLRRPKAPSPSWRSFLHNHMDGMAALDMFIVATVTFQLLYVLVVLGHDRRKIIHVAVAQHPTADWLARQITEAFPWNSAPRYLLRDRDAAYGQRFRRRVQTILSSSMSATCGVSWLPTSPTIIRAGRICRSIRSARRLVRSSRRSWA